MDVPLPDDLTPQKPQDRTRAILRSTLEMEATLIAIAIADHMDTDGEAWPCVATIAAETRIGERTVRDVITHGLDTGWLAARWRPGRIRVLRIVWERLADADRPCRTPGVRKPARDSDPARGAASNRHGAPEGERTDPARGAASNRHGAPVDPARGAASNRHGAPTKQTSEATMKQTSEATTLFAPATADAVIDPEPVVPQKPKRATSKATKGKDKPPPHPFHQRVIDAWDRCWRNAHPGTEYPWQTADVMQLVRKVRDPIVSTDEVRGTADMQRVGAAMKRYLSQRVDGTYVKGLSVRAFCGDVAKWLTPVSDSPVPPRPNASTPFVSIADMIAGLHQTSQPPARTGVVIDIEEPN